MFDALRFCHDHGLDTGKASEPWIAVECPWCGNTSSKGKDKLYGGINIVSEVFSCWRCGGKHINAYIRKATGKDPETIIWDYRSGVSTDSARVHATTVLMPDCSEMVGVHRNYLRSRGFDPDQLQSLYGLKGTGPICQYPTKSKDIPIDLSWRIVIPMRDARGQTVSWQARDITNRSSLRYIGCPDSDSITSYKTMLYGEEMARRDIVGVVEGVVDQWRMGSGFVATLGIGVTPEQIKRLSAWKRVVICFDSELQAQAKAHEIAGNLGSLGIHVDIVDLELGDRDAGDLSAVEAVEIRKELGF